MNTAKKLPLVQEMERAFAYLNALIFDNKLKIPTHVIQPERKHAFRFVADSYHIIIGGGFLDLKDVKEILTAYVHEMVHVYNYMNHISDCSSQYHKIGYMESAKAVGFYVARHKTQGWCLTTLEPPDVEHHAPTDEKNKFLKETIQVFEFPQDEWFGWCHCHD